MRRRRLDPARSEAGDTLIELLFTVVIISIAASALLGALITSIVGSAQHRGLSVDDTLLRSVAEAAKNQIETTSSNIAGTPLFKSCPTSYSVQYTPTMPSGYTVNGYSAGVVTLSNIAYWNGSDFSSSAPCSGSAIQEITVTASGPDREVQTLSFVVRTPNS